MATETGGVRPLARGMRAPRVLVVDDEENLRELLELTLVGMGLDVDTAPDIGTARRLIGERRYALCLTDMRLPDGNGLELVALLSGLGDVEGGGSGAAVGGGSSATIAGTRDGPDNVETPVAVITAYGSAENAVAALKAGAFDYLAKPVSLDALRALVRSALNLSTDAAARERGAGNRGDTALDPVARGSDASGAPVSAGKPGSRAGAGPGAGAGRRLIGDSAAMQAVKVAIARMARSMAPVAITGESGSGKELAARSIHSQGARAAGPFVAVNCGAIPETLMESEFFGYRKGAFTGADADRDGFFTAANGGTLFLDEVADLPLAMQVKLLRAIQEKRVRKVGAVAEVSVDVRIISATHQDLAQCVARGGFRQDLYYRLNVIELRMPSLRERREDIGELADALLERLCANAPVVTRLSSVTRRFLQSYDFPGNVRELENILERALAFSDGQVINVEDLGLKPMVNDESERDPASGVGFEAPVPLLNVAASAGMPAHARFPMAPTPGATPGAMPGELRGAPLAAALTGSMQTSTDPDAAPAGAPRIDDSNAMRDADGVPNSLPDYLDSLEREAILCALVKTRQNRTAAARLLGITFRALRYRMQRLEIQ